LVITNTTGKLLARQGDVVRVTGPTEGVGDTSCAPGRIPFVVVGIQVIPAG
jgi:hypothetical protein